MFGSGYENYPEFASVIVSSGRIMFGSGYENCPEFVTFHQNHHVVWQTKITNF
jgi:hypothetical protein